MGAIKGFRGILLCWLVLAVVLFSGVAKTIDLKFQDYILQQEGLVSGDICVIGIDEETLAALGPFHTWERSVMAELIEKLNSDPSTAPAVIGVDVLYVGETDHVSDTRLVKAASEGGNVVFGSAASFGGAIEDGQLKRVVNMYEEPFLELNAVSENGFTNVIPDKDGVVRRSMFTVDYNGTKHYSFAYQVYRAFTGKETSPRLDSTGQWFLTYSGKSGDYYGAQGQGYSMIKVLRGEIPLETFAGSVVLVGPYASGLLDSYNTPISSQVQMYGVEIHANLVQGLLEENYKLAVPLWFEFLILSALFIGTYFCVRRLDLALGIVLVVAVSAGYVFFARWVFGTGWVLPILLPILSVVIVYFYQLAQRYFGELKQRKRITSLFQKYVSPQVAQHLIKTDADDLKLGGVKRHISVMFGDIRGFTNMSSKLDPEDIVKILNSFFELTTGAVFENNGMVDKFIGDATMALFNAPLETEDYVLDSVRAAVRIMESTRPLEKEILATYGCSVGLGLGICCGEAVVGNIGTQYRMEYTAIGDTVNRGARLEQAAKAGEILIQQDLYDLVKDKIIAEDYGFLSMKGIEQPVQVYCVKGLK